eukprot:m.884923 g.884923  ORF g.884923 m.884923 type:complete len:154 (-) comp23613_c0_seq65:2508-2969(-)
MTSCVVLYRVSFCTVPHPFHNQALALGEDIDRKKQAAIAEVKAEKLNLDSQRLELHVHTLREPPRDSVAYNEWKIATEGLEQSAGQLVDESKTMRKEMKFLEERTDAKVRSHENDVFVALRKREQEYGCLHCSTALGCMPASVCVRVCGCVGM